MRDNSRRSRRSRTSLTLLASAVLAAGAAVGCDASGGNEPAPKGATDRGAVRPSPSLSPTRSWDRSPDSIAAVGDSITRAFDACEVLADCPEASWATGTDPEVRSLAGRLLGGADVTARAWNYARSSARIADLADQVGQAAAKRPELLTVMVGANDACRSDVAAMTPVAEFESSFTAALKRLRAASPKTYVYVASVPDLMRLWSEGRGNPTVRQMWELGVCISMLADPQAMDATAVERRQTVRDRVIAYNEVLKDVCTKDLRCRFDGNAVFEYPFGTKQLSQWDFFHPSKDGQARLAEIAYRNITAEKAPA
jgi:lysophospholipase L1-like esterase